MNAITGPRTCLNLYRGKHSGVDRWLYAIGRPDGITKVGISGCPRSRILAHWRQNDGIAWVHVFAGIRGERHALQAERRVLDALARVATRIRKTEEFRNLSREAALEVARREWRAA